MADLPPIAAPPTHSGHNASGDTEAIKIRDNRALELRVAGATYAMIAAALDCSASTAHQSVRRALDADTARIADLRDDYRKLQLSRQEQMVRTLWTAATRPAEKEVIVRDVFGAPKMNADGTVQTEIVRQLDYQAIDRLLRVLERQARFLGLDAPVRVALSNETSASIAEMLADLETLLATADDAIEVSGTEALEAGLS